jgi:hypothetical protein
MFELIGVLETRYPLVDQRLANVGAGYPETGYPVDGQAKAVGLVPDRKFQRHPFSSFDPD